MRKTQTIIISGTVYMGRETPKKDEKQRQNKKKKLWIASIVFAIVGILFVLLGAWDFVLIVS